MGCVEDLENPTDNTSQYVIVTPIILLVTSLYLMAMSSSSVELVQFIVLSCALPLTITPFVVLGRDRLNKQIPRIYLNDKP